MQKSMLKIKYTDKGLANFYGDYIEINKNLKKDKELRDYIVKHELGHIKHFDLGHDFKDGIGLIKKPKMLRKLLSFYILNPSTWTDLLPIQIRKKKINYDTNLLILYSLSIFLIITLIKIF